MPNPGKPIIVTLPSGARMPVDDQVADEVAHLISVAHHGGYQPTVHQAIAAVMAEVAGVGKDAKAPEKAGGYSYRGIEAVTAALRKLCGKHGVVIYPVTKITSAEPSPGMNPGWFDWRVEITWAVYGPDGSSLDPAPVTHGIGRDNSDKGVNKAMTQAFKYLLLQLFLISDDAHDVDGADYSGGRRDPAQDGPRMLGADMARRLAGQIGALSLPQREHLAKQWVAEDPMTGDPYLPVDGSGKPALRLALAEHETAILSLIAAAKRAAPDDADSPGEAPTAPPEPAAAPAGGTDTPEPDTGAEGPIQKGPGQATHAPDVPPGEEPF